MVEKQQHNRDRLQSYHKTVRVFGIRGGKFIEFDFTVGSEELTIELVMPYAAYKEFCETNHVAEIECMADVKQAYDKLADGQYPTLYDKTNIIQLGDFK